MNVVLAKPALECFDRGAGTHTELPRSAMHGMDSRFHGNDIDLLRLLANYAKLDKYGAQYRTHRRCLRTDWTPYRRSSDRRRKLGRHRARAQAAGSAEHALDRS